MASNTIAVIGATGGQGSSIVTVLLQAGWKVRGITRDVSKPSAQKLKEQGAEVVSANLDDVASLKKAFEGATAVFGVTNFWEHLFTGHTQDQSGEKEAQQGRNIADAADATSSLDHYIWSTLTPASKVSKGKLPVPHFDYKAAVDDYIREKLPNLAAKTTYLYFGFYAQNWGTFPMAKPIPMHPISGGKYILLIPTAASTKISTTGDMTVNPGIFVRQILANPQVSKGKYSQVSTHITDFGEQAANVSKVIGKEVVLTEVSLDTYEKIWGPAGKELGMQLKFNEEVWDWEKGIWGDKFVGAEALGIKPGELKDDYTALAPFKEALLSP